MQRHALEALARLAGGKSARRGDAEAVLACFASRDEAVRRAAIDAAIAFGDEAVTPIRQRLATATDVVERRALEEVLGRVGGKDAFTALLAALDTTDVERGAGGGAGRSPAGQGRDAAREGRLPRRR